jgi:alpha-ketoglutarate-dependent taurine dioxygenase
MPGATITSEGPTTPNFDVARTKLDKPLSYTGSLDSYSHSDLTPVIGTEYEGLQVVDLLSAKNSDALIRDLAVTVSQRGVVFLRNQNVTPQQMRELMERITVLAGSVSASTSTLMPVTDGKPTARCIRPARPPTHRRRQRARRPDQRDQLRETKEGWRIDTSTQRHQPLRECRLAFGHYLRTGSFRLCNVEDSHASSDWRRYCE